MSKDWTAPFVPECEATLSAVLAEYLEAVDRGEKPDREALLARHPLLAERLRAYFTDQDRIDAFAEPLRSHGAAEAAGLAYELLDEISRGGMGVVIRCRDRTLDRNLAIKVLLDRFRDRPDMVRRFVEEARITGRLQHPFIVPVHKLGALPDGRPYFAMKLVEGRTLAELLRDRPGPEQERTRFLKVFEQVCQTIAYAHSNGVIHRDLKPANIMVGAFGEVQVMDWGLAKVLADVAEDGEDRPAEAATHDTQAGAVLGTYAYMPPEQAGGMVERVSRPSDVFGLGAILCEILTGSPPYRGERTEVAAQARAGATEEALAWLDGSGADTELIQLARRCLRADPAERPADAAAVADAMARYFALAQERMRAAEIARAKAETEATEERKRLILAEAKVEAEEKRHRAERRRRRSTALLAAALLLLLVFGAAFGFWYQREQSTRVAEAATRQRVTERDVAAALAEVALRHEEGLKHVDNPERWKRDLTSAWDAWKRADNALGLGNADDDLRARVADARVILEQDERDRNLFATLERLWLERAGLSPEDVRAPRDAGAFFLAFKEYGLDLEALDPEEVAARLAKHPHRVRLGDEINIVAQVQADLGGKRTKLAQATFKGVLIQPPDWGKAQRLTRVLDRLDPDPDSFGSRWRAARVKGDTKTLIELARSPEAHGRSPRGCTALAHDLMAVKALPEAGDLLRAAHDRHPTDFWLNQVLGVVSLTDVAAGDVEAAKESLRYLTAALAARGNNAATQIVLSNVYKFLGKNKEAFRAANAAIEADSRSAPAYHNLGALHFSLAEWDKALAAFTKAADLDDRSPLPHDSLGQTYAAKLDFDAAIRHYKIALKRDPAFAGCYVNLGNALVAKNDIDGAIEKYHKALEIFPSYALAHFNLANALAKNNVKGALKSLEDTLVCDPDYAPALYAKGKLLLLYARDIPGAIACYQKVVDLHPKAPNAHFRMADLLQGLGRHAQAEASLRTLISLDQRYPEAHARLGIALAARGAWDEASAAYETALEQDKLPLEQKAVVLDSLGTVLLNKGDFEGAVKKHRAALALDTRRGLVAYNLGTAQMALGALEDAAESFADAVKQDARNPMFHLRLAMVRLHLKDLDQAIASAKEAVALAPGMAEAHNVLAQAYFDNLQFAEGLKALQQAKGQVRPADPGQNLLQAAYQAGEGLMKVDQVLPAFLRGDARAAESLPKTTLALITAAKHKRYLAAYRLYVDAFAAQPALAENLIAGCRAHAAGAAIRAATGDAEKDAKLDDAERARLRAQALAWLSAELDAWKRASPLVPAPEKGMARFRVRRWLVEADLAKVRDPEALKSLPALERDAWTKLWKDVAAFGSGAKGPVGPDLARLRKLAEFPSESLLFNVGYDGAQRDGHGVRHDPVAKIAELRAKLKGGVADGPLYLQLAYCYGDLKDKEKSRAMAGHAERLLRPSLETNDPKEVPLLLDYVRAHIILNPTDWKRQEDWVRRAADVAPRDWRAWEAKATACLYRAEQTIIDDLHLDADDRKAALKALLDGKAKPNVLAEVEKLLEETRRCFDRAKQLAPDSEEQWQRRIGYLLQDIDWINALRVARGKRPLPRETTPIMDGLKERGFKGGGFSLEALPDLLAEFGEAAERCPDHIGAQFFGIAFLLPRIKDRLEEDAPKDGKRPGFTPDENKFIDDTLARIEKIAAKANPEGAAYCRRVLAYLHLQLAMLDDLTTRLPRAEPYFRKLVDADPTDLDAADVLEFILWEQGRVEAALEIAQKRAATAPSARHRYLLARAFSHCDRDDEADKAIDSLLADDPANPYALAAKAVLLIRRDGKDDTAEAGRLLDKARAAIKPGERKRLTEDLDYLAAIHHAVSGRTVLARLCLESLRSEHKKDARLAEALDALGR